MSSKCSFQVLPGVEVELERQEKLFFFTAMFFIKVIKMTVKGDAGHSSLHVRQYFHLSIVSM